MNCSIMALTTYSLTPRHYRTVNAQSQGYRPRAVILTINEIFQIFALPNVATNFAIHRFPPPWSVEEQPACFVVPG